MRRLLLLLSLPLLLAGKFSRLTEAERDHYRALRIFMDEKEQKAWLKGKTEEERNAWLEEHGLWDRFYRHDEQTRDEIIAGEVELGWSTDMVYMAWGVPFQRQRLTGRQASRSELLVYRFEVDKEGYASPVVGRKIDYQAVDQYQVEAIVDDDVVVDLIEKPDWE